MVGLAANQLGATHHNLWLDMANHRRIHSFFLSLSLSFWPFADISIFLATRTLPIVSLLTYMHTCNVCMYAFVSLQTEHLPSLSRVSSQRLHIPPPFHRCIITSLLHDFPSISLVSWPHQVMRPSTFPLC
jgi:hypothetical protein